MPHPFQPPTGPEFDNCNFWITGATSGMGFEIARQLATQGASLWIMARNPQSLQATAQQLRLAGAKNVVPVALDLTVTNLAECIRRQVANVTFRGVLVNGGGPHGAGLLNFTAEDYDYAHALLLRGPALLTQALLPQLEEKLGSLVTISSTTVRELNPELPLSGAYRTGLMSLMKAFAEEAGKRGVRVNTVAPGYVRTEKLTELQTYVAQKKFGNTGDDALRQVEEEWASLSPLHRILEPAEIAELCLFLFSRASRSLTGQTFVADAGQLRML
jgi:3-oxoacyl-[acyl-carrier protein] reductase